MGFQIHSSHLNRNMGLELQHHSPGLHSTSGLHRSSCVAAPRDFQLVQAIGMLMHAPVCLSQSVAHTDREYTRSLQPHTLNHYHSRTGNEVSKYRIIAILCWDQGSDPHSLKSLHSRHSCADIGAFTSTTIPQLSPLNIHSRLGTLIPAPSLLSLSVLRLDVGGRKIWLSADGKKSQATSTWSRLGFGLRVLDCGFRVLGFRFWI